MMSYASPVSRVRTATALAVFITCATPVAWTQESNALPGDRDQEFNFSLSAGAARSDNIRRAEDDEESGTVGLAGIQLAYAQRSRRLESDIDVNATYENYSDDAFEDDVIGGANAKFSFGIVPDRFSWMAQENFGQVTSDPFAADTPDNRENINYFTTGPDLLLHFGGDYSIRIAARYSDLQYEVAPTDGTQYSGTLSLARELSSASSVSLVLNSSRFEFDDEVLNTDYDRNQIFLHYEALGRRTQLSADLGYTALEIGDESPSGALARFSISRQVSSSASMSASIGTQFSDAGELFREGQDLSGVETTTSSVVGAGDPFRSDFGSLSFNFDRHRTAFGVSVRAEHERYENVTALDRDLMNWEASVLRRISPTLDVKVFGRLTQQDFTNLDFDSDELDIGAYLNWTLGRRISLRLQYDQFDRDSSTGTDDYTEGRASLNVYWSPMAGRGASR